MKKRNRNRVFPPSGTNKLWGFVPTTGVKKKSPVPNVEQP